MQQEKARRNTHQESKLHLKGVRFGNVDYGMPSTRNKQRSARNSPERTGQAGVMSTSTVVLEFDQSIGNLGLQRQDLVSYQLFLAIMKDMRMVSTDNANLNLIP